MVPPFPHEDQSFPHPLDLELVEHLHVGFLVGESSEALLPVVPGGTIDFDRCFYILKHLYEFGFN